MTFTEKDLDALQKRLTDYDFIDWTDWEFQGAIDAITYLRAQRRELAIHIATDEGRVASQIEAAVKAERERCAKMMDNIGHPKPAQSPVHMARQYAQVLRNTRAAPVVTDAMVDAARSVPKGNYLNADGWMRAALEAALGVKG